VGFVASVFYALSLGSAVGQEVAIDPEQSLNDFVSVGEFSESGNVDGWGNNGSSTTLKVDNGALEVVTIGGDPWFFRSDIAGGLESFQTVEVRMRIIEGRQAGWEMFWGSAASPGFAAARRIGWSPAFGDDEFHVVHFDMSSVLNGSTLTHFRIDPTGGAGVKLEVDYVRLGTVSPDSDNDGLADRVETGTGIFVDSSDTGTDSNKSDTDGDGFNDSIEIEVGTDPNSADEIPIPALKGYTISKGVYVVTVEVSPSEPMISVGEVTSFSITPSLPAGLSFDTKTGRISGTPSDAKDVTDYTVSASFATGEVSDTIVNIEVRNPFIEYTVSKRSLLLDQEIPDFTFVPNVFGPAPTSYSISPNLPDGLVFDAVAGDIFDTPFENSPTTEYTVTAAYSGYPDSTTKLTLSVLGRPVATVDPEVPIDEVFSLGEFDNEADLALWAANPRIAPLSVLDGSMVVETIGGDPFMSTSFEASAGCQIVEMRIRLLSGDAGWQVFWGEEAVGRGNFGAPGQPFSLPEVIDDGEFHTYRIDFTTAAEGPLLAFRLDPGAGAGTVLDIDYIRLLGCTKPSEPASISFERADANQIAITWTGLLQSTANLGSAATNSPDPVWASVLGESPISVGTDGPQRFYRSVDE
jgi:hypothetical protein